MSLAVVTAWQNHRELEQDFFAAVDAGKPDQLVIVDDRSDHPLPYAAARIETGEQGGFSRANNVGLELVETDHVLFLNNDVKPVRADWLDQIRAAVTAGVLVGPLIERNPLSEVDGRLYPYIDGWCVAMTTADARNLGGWDEAYDAAGPGYFSDNALSFKANVTPPGMALRDLRPGLEHKGGQTGGSGPAFQYALMVNGPLFQEQVRAAVAPVKFWLYGFAGKELYLRQTLYGRGHTQAELLEDADLLLVDTDAPWAHPRPGMIAAAKQAGAKVAVFPHGGLPVCWMYDGLCEPSPDVDVRLEHGPGSVELAELLGLDLRQHAAGWLYSPTLPFAPVGNPRRLLFAPLHPIMEGLANPATNGNDPGPAWNQDVYRRLLTLGYDITVTVVGPPHRSGVWPHPRATIVANHQMSFTDSFQQVMAADVVVAAGTIAATAVACGKPVVMFAQENFRDYVDGEYPQAANPGLYRDLIRYPLDAGDGDLDELIGRACAGDEDAALWRERFVGDDGADDAAQRLEELVTEVTVRNVIFQGATARGTARGR